LPTSLVSEPLGAADLGEALADQVRRAAAERRPLRIAGGDTKAFYGRPVEGEPLQVAGHAGVVDYDPAELVMTARAGTRLADIEARLAQHGQMLAFEPPRFGPAGTWGGAIAAGLSGPRRPFAGALRDCMLGVTVIDGQGRVLRFGGQVFKNVAGFDLFRLTAGALGSLGVILEASVRVAPAPARETALALELDPEAARERVIALMREPGPLSGAFHDSRRLHLRLSGGEAGVEQAARALGGDTEPLALWDEIRDFGHPVFAGDAPLWRLSLPQTAPTPAVGALVAWDWAGSVRWITTEAPAEAVFAAAAAAGGHATLFRGAPPGAEVFQPLAPPLLGLHQRLKAALDPAAVLNPGRLYGSL